MYFLDLKEGFICKTKRNIWVITLEKINLGRSELKVSRVGLGTLAFGHKSKGIQDKQQIFDCLNYALDNGINLIDTAEEYSGGLTERLIGEVLKERGDREEVVIVTKVSPMHLSYNNVLKAAKHSLERLQTNYIDIFMVHWPWPYNPILETMKAMDKLLEEGKIHYVGISNFKNYETQEAINSLENGKIIVNEMEYNLVNRFVEKEIVPFIREKGIALLAYSPLLSSFLTAKYDEYSTFSENDFRNYDPYFKNKENFKHARELFQLMKDIAENHEVTPAQVAMNWLLKDEDIIPIPGAKKISHIESNIESTKWKLTKEEYSQLTKITDELELNTF
ncbi:MAG: aldo/keto reductase [Candidatus Heimdallarchaeota archaeon]|nr:aldo/keto reductase [Candidatus Heimdallarchaeota archaeon]